MNKLAPIVLCSLLFGACSPSGSQVAKQPDSPKSPSILEQPLSRKDIQQRIKEAEQDLPTDEWVTNPMSGHYNHSRWQRELNISNGLLQEIEPKLKKMSVPELVDSIMTEPTNSISVKISGVADELYIDGNQAIINELKKRPNAELEYLKKFQRDWRFIVDGPQGGYTTIGSLCQEVFIEHDMIK